MGLKKKKIRKDSVSKITKKFEKKAKKMLWVSQAKSDLENLHALQHAHTSMHNITAPKHNKIGIVYKLRKSICML